MQTAITEESGKTGEGGVLVEYGITDAAIAELRERLGGLTIATPDDYKKVKGAIAEVKSLRIGVEKKRVDLKSDALAWGKKVDVEAKRITGLLVEIEDPLKVERTRVDDEKEAEKTLIAEQKQQRIDELRGMIEHIRSLGNLVYGKASDVIEATIDKLGEIDITDEQYQEYAMEARQVMKQALTTASDEYQNAVDREREAASQARESKRLEGERAEQAQKRQEQDEKFERQQADIKKQQEALDAQAMTMREAAQVVERKKREDAEEEQRQADLIKEEEQRDKDAETARLRDEALRPDKEKLLAFAGSLKAIEGPKVESGEAKEVVKATLLTLASISEAVRIQCATL